MKHAINKKLRPVRSVPKPLDIVFHAASIYHDNDVRSLSIKDRLYAYQSAQIQARINRRNGGRATYTGKHLGRKKISRRQMRQKGYIGRQRRPYFKTRLLNKKQQQGLWNKNMDKLTLRQRLIVEKTQEQAEKRRQNRLKYRSIKNEKVIAKMAGKNAGEKKSDLTSIFGVAASQVRRKELCERAQTFLNLRSAQTVYMIEDIERVFQEDFLPFIKGAGMFDVSVNEQGYSKRLKTAFDLYEKTREEYFDQYAGDIFKYQAELERMDIVDALLKSFLSTAAVKELNIVITSVYDIADVVQEQNIGAVLSIEHPGAETVKGGRAPRFDAVEQKILCFWDTENEDIPQGPTMIDVAQGLAFIENNKDRRIAVHCKAGKRRSVAIVLAYLAKEKGIKEAIALVKEMRSIATPNILVIALADKYLNMGGELFKAVNEDPEFHARAEEVRARIKHMPKTSNLEMR